MKLDHCTTDMSKKAKIMWSLKQKILTFFVVTFLIFPVRSALEYRKTQQEIPEAVIKVDIQHEISDLNQFWKSTGFCPPLPHQEAERWFLSRDMRHNLAYIGAIPHAGIRQVRVHWLLDAVKTYRDKYEIIAYNFTFLDEFVDILWQNGLYPGFEVMGNPGNIFTDFENETQLYEWRNFLYQLVHRYADNYGLSYLNDWNFESWNEPSLHHFDGLNFTIKGFLNYYDTIADVLEKVSPSLRLGGPGGACWEYDVTSYCWALLHHVVHGRNDVGEKPFIDYISIHRKGEEPNNTAAIFDKEIDFYTNLVKHLPELADTPIYNDEADPLVTWSRERWWRADVTYAAMVVKIITEHQNKWIVNRKKGSLNFQLLSNDNGFLSYNPHFFTQRTLLARFQINNTATAHVQFVRKPVYAVMGLLGMLGERQLYASVSGWNTHTGVLASKHVADTYEQQDSNSWSVIVYNSADTNNMTSLIPVRIQMDSINCTDCRYVVYVLDNARTNPHAVWTNAGSPLTPSTQLFRDMRQKEEPVCVKGPSSYSSTQGAFNFSLPLPGVLLMHICDKAQIGPDQVTNVVIHNVTVGQVLITWDDGCVNTKCIKTYMVEFASYKNMTYIAINSKDIIFNSYVYMPGVSDDHVAGLYRVRAVDYWGRPGAFSLPTRYP